MEWVDNLRTRIQRKIAHSAIEEAVQKTAQGYQDRIFQLEEAQQLRVEDLTYTRLTTRGSETLNPIGHDFLNKAIWFLFYNNPLFKRLVTVPVDFCYQVAVKTDERAHPDLQKVIDDFWKDPYNDLEGSLGQYVERLNLEGELLLLVDVNSQDGHATIRFEEPKNIKQLHVLASDKRFVDTVEMVAEAGEKEGKKYKVVRYQKDPNATLTIGDLGLGNQKEVPSTGYRTGEAFYFRMNHLVTGRGRPPLEASIDMIDAHDHSLFDQLRNVALQGAFVWDVELQGANETAIADWKAKHGTPPKPGSLRVHNEAEKWLAQSPEIDTKIATDLLVQIRKVIALGRDLSETWVAASDDINRSTGEVSDSPPLRHLEREQRNIENMVRFMIDFAIDMAVLHGTLTLNDTPQARLFTVSAPDLVSTDSKEVAEALNQLTQALTLALQNGLIDKTTARTIWYNTANVPMPLEVEKTIEKEQDEMALEDYRRVGNPGEKEGPNSSTNKGQSLGTA
jgi:hypothetical protein